MSKEELIFSSTDKALQHLSDLTGKKIKIATNEFLYHATYKPLLKSIQQNGLIKNSNNKTYEDSKDFIYLAENKEIAESYAETSDMVPEEWLDQIIIFKIPIKKLNLNKLHPDQNVIDGNSTYQYDENIPFSNLLIIK